jgi:hypothetical protein
MNRLIVPCCIASLALIACNHPDRHAYWGNESDMKGYFEGVSTQESELKAAKDLNERFKGYEVHAFDNTGKEIRPYANGSYDAVYRVTIKFDKSDITVSRIILNRRSLTYIYGE